MIMIRARKGNRESIWLLRNKLLKLRKRQRGIILRMIFGMKRLSIWPCQSSSGLWYVSLFPLSHTPIKAERSSIEEVADIQIPELEGKGLLKRVSPVDRLDNIMLRCEVDYETVKSLAKELKVVLDDYIYEAVQ
jgi:hypothetical protein